MIYQATVATEDNRPAESYVGLTENSFKTRYSNHKSSFRDPNKRLSTELSKHIWHLKDTKIGFSLAWKILKQAATFNPASNRCNLCLWEKYFIICRADPASLNERNELVTSCRHALKFLLSSFTSSVGKPPKDGTNLLDLMEIFGLDCLITKATRKTKTSEKLLDLILTSNKKKTLVSDVVDTQISDHLLVFTILRSRAPRSRSRKICVRSFKNFNRDKFIQDLQMAPFSIVDVFDEVDDKLYAFEQLYHEILNEHAPLKQTIVRGNQVPYMTEQWRKAIRHRNKLWRLFMRDRTDANYDHYKIQRNICTSLRRKVIKEHFVKKSSEPENPREFWNAYRPFLHGKTKQANDIIITENNAVISDKREIAELFNAHFIQIADGVPLMKETDYGQHFENHPSIIAIHEKNKATDAPLCFNFEHINQAQVERALLDVNVRKSCGHDMLSPRLVKESASVIAKPITNILNTSIEQGCYPNAWKMGQVTPLFKKDDESSKANYRPVRVLPCLIMSTRDYYQRSWVNSIAPFCRTLLVHIGSSTVVKLHYCG